MTPQRPPSALRQGLLLAGLALAAAAVSNLMASPQRRLAWIGEYPDALKLPARQPTTAALQPAAPPSEAASEDKAFPPHPDRPSADITGDDALLLHSRGTLFLDARRSKVFEEGHIRGARSFPVWEADIDARVKALYEEGLDQSAPLVVYCSGGSCEDSHMLAQRLYMVGFDNVLVYTGGFPDWEARKAPVEKGAAP
ncbi:MAG: rhodanese-like domain-containing protein [Thermoanaerobaculia bacterium]